MASSPTLNICDDDLDELAARADRHHRDAATAPAPDGLEDRRLRLARSGQDPNGPDLAEAPAGEARKVKLAGRRRLCKLAAAATTQQLEEDEEEQEKLDDDGDRDRDVLDDLDDGGDRARDVLDDLDDDIDKPAAAPAPAPNGLEQRRLSLARSFQDPNPKLAEAPAGGKARKVKLAGRRRLCKLAAATATPQLEEQEQLDDDGGGGDSTRDVLDDLTTRLGSLSVHRPKPNHPAARPGDEQQLAPSPCAIAADPDEDVAWEETEDFEMEPTGTDDATSSNPMKPYRLPGEVFRFLFLHQREGLRWLWALHCRGTGGILGDDMGLGKTIQVSSFLAGLFHSRLIKRVLIVAPKTLLAQWITELSAVGLKQKISDYFCPKTDIRNYELQYVFKEGGVLLTTYDIVRNSYKLIRGDSFNNDDDDEEGTLWDYVILDEGHLIKNNKTQRAQSLFQIPCAHRIVISGTPIQNNLKEMWALFNFCCPDVLGDEEQFKMRYEMAIVRGNDKNATAREKLLGSKVAKELREQIKPYFLRRMKSEGKMLAKKNELTVWLKLTACQRKFYEVFLKSDLVHLAVQPKGSPLAAITILEKICDHPLLLTKKAAEDVLEGMDEMLNDQDIEMVEKMAMNLADMAHDDDALGVGQDVSCKLSFIMSLLRNLVKEGHHVLIFSQTRIMLNLIQEAILSEGYKFLRIDGTTEVSDRERIVKDFQEGPGAPIFLLTKGVGGLGLTLTKAARVIIFEPSWNPSTDNQSVDRAYRIGQTKDVIVYRLMTSATIEEKIYKLQVIKAALFRTATEQKEQTRYFSRSDIREFFSLPEQGFDVSLTQKQLQEEYGQQVVMDESLRQHIQFLEQQGIAGVSHHSLLFSKTATLPTLLE